jgi:hypothetical protein
MKEYGTNDLFEVARKAPTELPQEQVMEMITKIPTLPPPGNSWFNINLNSIIMTTTVAAIIGSAMIYFSTPANTELPGQEPGDQSTQPILVEESTGKTSEDSLTLIAHLPAPKRLSNTANPVNPIPVNTAEPFDPQGHGTAPDLKSENRIATKKSGAASSPPDRADSPYTNAGIKRLPVSIEEDTPSSGLAGASSPDVLQLRKLKRLLLRELSKDNLIKNKRFFHIVHYQEGKILVNQDTLNRQSYTKYNRLLQDYDLTPGPEMRVLLDPRFIMVGNFTEDGFDGKAYGREMNIDFMSQKVISNGLMHMSSGKGRLEMLIKSDDKSLFDKNNDSGERLNLNATQLKALKKDLYKNLLADHQIDSKDADVSMIITPTEFRVNKNDDFDDELKSTYTALLATHGIKPMPDRKVLLSKDFIMVIDFHNGKLAANVQGKLTEDKIEGSIFESDLRKIPVFTGDSPEDADQHEERSLPSFNHLVVSGLAVVHLTQGDREDIRLEVSGMPIKDVLTEVKNDTLTITTLGEHHGESIDIYVTNPAIRSLEVSGSAELYGQNQFLAAAMNILIRDSAAAYLDVDVLELFILMDGGDLDIGGRYKGKEVRYGKEAPQGTLKSERLTRK